MKVGKANQAVCERCGRAMQAVANIAPIGRSPGLVAFVCSACGATDSTLVYPANRIRQVDHERERRTGKH